MKSSGIFFFQFFMTKIMHCGIGIGAIYVRSGSHCSNDMPQESHCGSSSVRKLRIQSTLVISTSLISNSRLCRSENLDPVQTKVKNVEKRSNSSFSQYFQYISNFRSQFTWLFVKCGGSIYFFPKFCKSDLSIYGYLEVFQSWISR